jgi:hypothetical protein
VGIEIQHPFNLFIIALSEKKREPFEFLLAFRRLVANQTKGSTLYAQSALYVPHQDLYNMAFNVLLRVDVPILKRTIRDSKSPKRRVHVR